MSNKRLANSQSFLNQREISRARIDYSSEDELKENNEGRKVN